MAVVLHRIRKRDDGIIELSVSVGAELPQDYLASFDGSDPKYKFCSTDETLFMLLSNQAHKRFGNCTVYQIELMGIISAFVTGERIPDLPVELGTTRFCRAKPGPLRIAWNKLWYLFYRMGLYRPRMERAGHE